MKIPIAASLLALSACSVHAQDLTLDQKLIVACYRLQADQVVMSLRKGAEVNSRFGESKQATALFVDHWTGAIPLCAASWTPLLALSNSPIYPVPPTELSQIWKYPARSARLRRQIPRELIERRKRDAVTILQVLLSHNCNLEDHDGYGATALFEAASAEKTSIVEILLEAGANANVSVEARIDGPGDLTPLHVACRSKELVQMLLDHGANAYAHDSEGRRPADWIALHEGSEFDLIESPNGWRIGPRTRHREEIVSDPFVTAGDTGVK